MQACTCCMCVCVREGGMAVRGHLAFSPSAMGSRNHTQSTSLGSEHLYWLNHLTGPKTIIFQVFCRRVSSLSVMSVPRGCKQIFCLFYSMSLSGTAVYGGGGRHSNRNRCRYRKMCLSHWGEGKGSQTVYTWADTVPGVRCHSESRKKGKGWERKGRRLIVKLPGSPAGLKLLAILLPQPSAAGLGPFSLPTSLFGGLLSMEQCWRLRCDPFRIRLTCCFWKLQLEPQVPFA